ncbi:Uma2 family endonuclease [Armatimonas sp.]|uniref:Uma2 family endonuclease n=1 Tax=Armatimonas sp. TaxID=1872638 RepID=UPI0037516502
MSVTLTPTQPTRRVVYPTSDGKPMAETDLHIDLIAYCRDALRAYFLPCANEVYVSGNNFVFFRQGDPTAKISPDCYVVFEFTSKKTRNEDIGEKLLRYESLRVPEYFLFDPKGEYLQPALRGYRLTSLGMYAPIAPDAEGCLHSQQLGLVLVQENRRLRLRDSLTGELLRSAAEAEEEITRLRAELERLRGAI